MLELTERWLELCRNTNGTVGAVGEHVPGWWGGGPEQGRAGAGTNKD